MGRETAQRIYWSRRIAFNIPVSSNFAKLCAGSCVETEGGKLK
jgi:hypothetical protein